MLKSPLTATAVSLCIVTSSARTKDYFEFCMQLEQESNAEDEEEDDEEEEEEPHKHILPKVQHV